MQEKNSKTELLKSKLLLYLYIQLEVVDLQITNYPWLKLVLFFAAGFYLSTRLNFQSEVLSCFALNFFFQLYAWFLPGMKLTRWLAKMSYEKNVSKNN